MELSCSKKNICIITLKTSKIKGDFYCLNCLYSFKIENKPKSHEKVCKNKAFCGIVMSTENKIIEFNTWNQIKAVHYLCWYSVVK